MRKFLTVKNLLIASVVVLLIAAAIIIPTVIIPQESFTVSEPTLIAKGDEVLVALFWADWCGHCTQFKPTYDKISKELTTTTSKRPIRFESINAVELAALAKKHGITGYPTIKIIQKTGTSDYDGDRDYSPFKSYLLAL